MIVPCHAQQRNGTMNNRFAARMQDIPPSEIRQVFEQVRQMSAEGRSIVPFHIGEPDFDTPAHIKAAAFQALDAGLTHYTSNAGLPELRRAIADKLARDNGLLVNPDTQIIVTVGANEAVLLVMLAFLNPGDEVLIPDPTWLHYFHCARLAGAKPVSVPLHAANGFLPDPDDLRRFITPRTRMLLINTPHNPTGVVYPRDLLAEIAQIAADHDLLLLSDEIYEKIIYDAAVHISLATFPAASDRTITINGFSKAYAMTGWRLGYLTAPVELMSGLLRVHQYTTVCATSFAQAGAVAALTGPQDPLANMVAEFDQRRRVIVRAFQDMPGCALVTPQGAFYAFPRIPASIASAEFARKLLGQIGVAVVPGAAFGAYGEGFVRIAYSCSLPAVQTGMSQIRAFLA